MCRHSLQGATGRRRRAAASARAARAAGSRTAASTNTSSSSTASGGSRKGGRSSARGSSSGRFNGLSVEEVLSALGPDARATAQKTFGRRLERVADAGELAEFLEVCCVWGCVSG